MNRRDALRSACGLAGVFAFSGFQPVAATFAEARPYRIEPFHINFGRDAIDGLHRRIDAMLWPEIPFDSGWSEGTNDKVLRDLAQYWRHEYDWFVVQRELNALDHYRVVLGGERVHFVWYRGTGERQPLPLLLLHGWPSSFFEFSRAAPALMHGIGRGPGFDVVVPSLPGFVFSDAPRKRGMHVGRIADRLHELMQELGYRNYGVQGGDWGAVIGVELARKYPNAVRGLHYVAAPSVALPEMPKDEAEREFVDRRKKFNAEETAYFELQSTKPQTLAYALQDSPVGLLAWLLEKYWSWTDHSGDLWEHLDRKSVVTTASLYWLSGCVLSAARIYYETRHMEAAEWSTGPVSVPTAYARFPGEPWGPPRSLLNPDWKANLLRYTEMSRGGHFPALEQPELYAKDVASFFKEL